MICKNCIHKEVCKHKTESVYECEHFKDGTIKNQYDRIRNMSVEELARFLAKHIDCYRAPYEVKQIYVNAIDNKTGKGVIWIKAFELWLESEVDTE